MYRLFPFGADHVHWRDIRGPKYWLRRLPNLRAGGVVDDLFHMGLCFNGPYGKYWGHQLHWWRWRPIWASLLLERPL